MFFDDSPVGHCITSPHGELLRVNTAFAAMLGYTTEELQRLSFAMITHPDDQATSGEMARALLAGDAPSRVLEKRYLTRDGRIVWATVTTSLSRDADGTPLYFLTHIVDLSERSRSDLRISVLTKAVEQSPASVIITDIDGRIEYVNARFTEIWGYTLAEVIGRTPGLLGSGLTPRATYETLWSTITSGGTWRGELQNRTKAGALIWIAASISPIRDASGQILRFVGVQENVTDRKAAELALAASAARVTALMEHASDSISVLTTEGVLVDGNNRLTRALGLADGALIGRPVTDLLAPEDVDAVSARFRDAIANGGGTVAGVRIARADGTHAVVDFSMTVVALGEERMVLSIGRDVTEQRSLETQLRQAQKMEAVGQLAGGVAHDFNNVLTAITGYAELLKLDLPDGDPRAEDVDEIQHAVKRAAALTRQLLAFSRQQVLQPVVLDPNGVIAGVEKMLQRLIGEDVELVTQLGEDIGRIKADPGQIEQILMNLVVNARDAMPSGGRITIATSARVLDEAAASVLSSAAAPGTYAVLSVTDNGVGMTPEIRQHIFEPFFTTKSPGKGTGLGLATVYGIVQQSGGHVTVYSEVDQGTTFRVYLPAVDDQAQPVAAAAGLPLHAGTETILLAEDDEAVRAIATEILQRGGYTVLAARNGEEALSLAERFEGYIQLVITDVVMTGIDGPAVVRELRKRHPHLKVLFISGYAGEAIVRRGVLESGVPFLEKPFTAAGLTRKVRDILDSG